MDIFEQEAEEPPERCYVANAPLVWIGRNSRGQWVVQEQEGLFGGLFVDRKSAIHFALHESGHRPESVIVVSHVLELDLGLDAGRRPSALAA